MPGWKSLYPEFTIGPRLTGSDQSENGPIFRFGVDKTILGPIAAPTAPVAIAAFRNCRRGTPSSPPTLPIRFRPRYECIRSSHRNVPAVGARRDLKPAQLFLPPI